MRSMHKAGNEPNTVNIDNHSHCDLGFTHTLFGTAMYVCLCNGITENQIRDAVQEGASSLRELKLRLGVASCCGKCADCAQQVVCETLLSGDFREQLNAA